MNQISVVGTIRSLNGIYYKVRFDSQEKTAWISKDGKTWELVCHQVSNENSAIKCTQAFIDTQPNLF